MYKIFMLKKIALRNLARHKIKTLLTASAVMVSVAVYIFLNSWLGGMAIESRRNIVNYEIGAAKLQTRNYFDRKDEMPSYETFTEWEIYREALLREGYSSAPRFVFSGMLISRAGSLPVLFHGVEPSAEAEVLHYVNYVDFGRYVRNGHFEIAIGALAAERLRVGIPTRPLRAELEELINFVTQNSSYTDIKDANFIRSLYDIADTVRRDPFSPPEVITEGNERLILKRDTSRADLNRYWDMIVQSGRNDVRINAVIDMRAVPEVIRIGRWEDDLIPYLSVEERNLIESAYQYEEFAGAYILSETDEEKLDKILNAMITVGFSGAVRHVNQLIDVVVVGVINSPAPLPNGNTAFIPLDVLQDESGMLLEGAVTELIIRERNAPYHRLPGESESSSTITAALERGLYAMGRTLPENLAVFTWQDYMADYLGYEVMQTAAPQVFAFLLLILSFLGISNTILLAILERTKEIGMMRALGMTDNQLIQVFMLEAGFLGFIGAILGIILGCIINYPMVEYGLDFSAMADVLSGGIGFRITTSFRSVWNIPVIIGSGIVAAFLASFMAYFPTRRAVKMPITQSLRFE